MYVMLIFFPNTTIYIYYTYYILLERFSLKINIINIVKIKYCISVRYKC